VDLVELAAKFWPRAAAGVLGDPGQEECRPAEGNAGADPVFAPVPDGAQVDDLLHVFPAALDFEQLLVPDGDVFRGQVGVRGAEQVFPVQVFLGFRLRGVDPEQAARGNAQVAVQAGPGGDDAAQLGRACRR
jgi:hypothetical protein